MISDRFLFMSSFFYLFALSLKVGSLPLERLTVTQPILMVKQFNSLYLGLALLGLLITLSLSTQRYKLQLRFSPSLVLFWLFFAFYILRLLFDEGADLARVALAFFVHSIVTIYLASVCCMSWERRTVIISAICLWGCVYTFLSAVNLISGFGYVNVVPRFYGITSHPNAAGVALAISALVTFDGFMRYQTGSLVRWVLVGAAIISSYLCLLTASRTALSMLLLGAILYAFGKRLMSSGALMVLFSLMVMPLMGPLLLGDGSASAAALERINIAGNNRFDVWRNMFDGFDSNIFFGAGIATAGTENSYLKALYSAGLFVGIIFISSIILACHSSISSFFYRRKNSQSEDNIIFSVMIIALSVGAFLEGFLVELAGPWIFLLLLSEQMLNAQDRVDKGAFNDDV